MYTSKKVIFLLILISLLINALGVIAFAEEDKIENQNELIYEEIMRRKDIDRNPLDKVYEDLKKSDEENRGLNLRGVSDFLYDSSIKLSLLARKIIVPITLLVLLFNIFMLAFTGAKSIKNRKKYIVGSILFYIVFLTILNLPIYLLWRHSVGSEEIYDLNAFYRFADATSIFLKSNSFVIFIIIFAFGVVNRITSELDLPKRLASNFVIKISFVLLLLFNIMPFLLKLAI